MDKDLKDFLSRWKIIHPSAFLIEQDEAPDTYQGRGDIIAKAKKNTIMVKGRPVEIIIPEEAREREQTAIGTGIVIAKYEGPEVEDEQLAAKLEMIQVGDRVKFSVGTQINAEIKGFLRVQILHLQNIIMVERCLKK